MKGKDLADHIANLDPEILKNVFVLVADTTSVNTGCNKGVFKLVRDFFLKEFSIEIHTLECLLHTVELLFKHFFLHVEGPTSCADKLKKNAVYNMIGKINGTVDLKQCGDSMMSDTLTCSTEARKIIRGCLDRYETDKVKIRDDHACLLVYTAYVCGFEIPDGLKRMLKYNQEVHGLARWVTTGSGYLRIFTLREHFKLTKKQLKDLKDICLFIVNVYTPSYLEVYYHPSAVEGPANILVIRDLLLSVAESSVKKVIEEAVKHIFIAHALTWFTPLNLGLSLLSETSKLTIQVVVKIRKQVSQESRKVMLWQKNKKLLAFMSPDVAAATCLHHGSPTFWRACMNSNLSCERYVGRVKIILQSGKLKDTPNVDRRIRGYINLAYDTF